MPFTQRETARIYWKLEGEGSAPALVLLNSIGTDMDLWDPVLPALRASHRVLRLDTRGHGASDAPPGDYTLSQLAEDVYASMDAAGISRAAIAGVSLGGMIAMEMALSRPERLDSLALVCTSASMDRATWSARVQQVREHGMGAIADLVLSRFLSAQFIASNPPVAATLRRGLMLMEAAGYAGCAAAIRDMELAPRLRSIRCPALIVTGDRDVSTPFAEHGERILQQLASACHVELPAAHLAPLEAPEALTGALRGFLSTRS